MDHGAKRNSLPQPGSGARPGPSGGPPSQAANDDHVIDRDRLIWDPEYRREVARLLRRAPAARS